MNIETSFFNATDGVDLKGILYKADNNKEKILISVHGMATNCIKQRDKKIAEQIQKIGVDFLSFNNRGHDLVNYINKEDSENSELAGTAYEEVSECYNDILGAINYAISKGYKDIYLMGHSLGSTKVIYAYQKIADNDPTILPKIKGILLLSLVDIPTSMSVYLKDDFPAMITYAKNMKKESLENELMPEKTFVHPISVKTFLRYAIDNKDIDFARFSDKTYQFDSINKIKIPLFMRWGNNKEMILQEADELCDNLKAKITNNNLDIGYIDGANHSYDGKEQILAEDISEFLKNI